MDPPTDQPAGAASSFKTPQMDQSEWSAATPTTTTTPSRHTFPRRLSLLQNEAASPARSDAPQEGSRRTSFTGPKPLNLVSQPLSSAVPSSASSSGPDTPRRGKRTSLSYIPSPSTSKIDDGQLSRAQSTSSASGRTRTGSISRATNASRRRPSQASQASAGANSDADDWLMSEEDASFSLPSAARAMTQRDSAKVEAQFQDTGYREGITAGKLSTLQNGFDQGFNEVGAPLGREVGMLRGQLAALLLLTSPSPSADAAAPRKAVDANGIATPSVQLGEQPPPTPPKEGVREGNAWQSRRTSVLGSWSQLQSKLTGEADSGGGGLAGMFSRRLREARDNASDLLREAERKLGNAMTIDDLLGISNDEPASPQPPVARSRSPQIRLEGVATQTSWAEAAVGVRSPNLAPADAVGRTSVSSSRSSLSLQLPVRSASPHSPPIGGAPGAAAFGVLHNGSNTSINRISANSVDGWNWTKHEQEWDG
ncbi:hypothetical protein PANT_10c00089 [Moesziomyces antarcticus T-34]|uniref:Protein YAE1 n=1 Tax=Pseudozyma antarctica (strain T-34) TaxID=1151754 RepID=M9LPW3_PSEA3|nr:hypothetical protein PANT_10c00089 [Moesziomyces antarcticus T-34]